MIKKTKLLAKNILESNPTSGGKVRPKRRRNIPENRTKYHNARNGFKFQQLNNLRQMARINRELDEDQIKELTPDIFQIAKERATRRKEKAQIKHTPRIKPQPELKTTGRWFNHGSKEYETLGPKKKQEYY